MERPGITLEGTVLVYVYAVSEGTVWGALPGLAFTGGFTPVTLGGMALGASIGLLAAWGYLPRVRGGEG